MQGYALECTNKFVKRKLSTFKSSMGLLPHSSMHIIWPDRAAGNVSGYRCMSDCRYRVASLIPAWSHTFVEIYHEIISAVILLPSADSFKKGCWQLQATVNAQTTG